ncbi:MAG: transposase [Ruminococcaceae bacterium]|nr:transposase [Oscillospiraceae bacterium]
MELNKRKAIRLKSYNYDQTGAYFITICTKNRKKLFWNNVGATIGRPQKISLSTYGNIVETAIKNIPKYYPAVSVDKYTIMPDHIHLLLQINSDKNGRAMHAPTISTVIQQTKGYVTKQIGFPLWQKLFYDHVIRDHNDYDEIWQYMENNPLKYFNNKE